MPVVERLSAFPREMHGIIRFMCKMHEMCVNAGVIPPNTAPPGYSSRRSPTNFSTPLPLFDFVRVLQKFEDIGEGRGFLPWVVVIAEPPPLHPGGVGGVGVFPNPLEPQLTVCTKQRIGTPILRSRWDILCRDLCKFGVVYPTPLERLRQKFGIHAMSADEFFLDVSRVKQGPI